MILSAIYALDGTASGECSAARYALELLKHSLGTPMNCSAFQKNLTIAQAFREGRWTDAEHLCAVDNVASTAAVQALREAESWAFDHSNPTCKF